MNWRLSHRVELASGRIKPEDAKRQMRTARSILERFDRQPGIVLADEVGMGKTFVALAVAVSVLEQTQDQAPVVVMVPAAVGEKWPRDWEVFQSRCLNGGPKLLASPTVRRGSDFLKLLDDPKEGRNDIIFLTHGALTGMLTDPMVRMAIVRSVLMRPSLKKQRGTFPKFAGHLMPGGPSWWAQDFVAALLDESPRKWRQVWNRDYVPLLDDDPVPKAVLDALKSVDLDSLAEALRGMPRNWSKFVEHKLRGVRRELDRAMQDVWKVCLSNLNLRLPLLILDEAHHTRNAKTRLAGLFASADAQKDVELLKGPFNGVFDRMLFLTATPFQLAHSELVEVLRRFDAVAWSDEQNRAEYEQQVDELGSTLDAAQRSAQRLDFLWGKLDGAELSELPEDWWRNPDADSLPERARLAAQQLGDLAERNAGVQKKMRPLVIRHARPDRDTRRNEQTGAAILPGASNGQSQGLQVGGPAMLPFLLAARTQAIVAMEARADGRTGRAHFAEGLASSFEAYRHTRDDVASAQEDEATGSGESSELPGDTGWYLRQIDEALPESDGDVWGSHPKISATVRRSLDLWDQGEKVLIFCFYVATGRSLRRHVSAAIGSEIVRLGAEKLGADPNKRDFVLNELRLLSNRFLDPGSPAALLADRTVREILVEAGQGKNEQPLNDALLSRATDAVTRFLRTPAFLVRFVDDIASRRSERALEAAFDTKDSSQLSLRQRLESFANFLIEREPGEREELIGALGDIETGSVIASEEQLDDAEGTKGDPNRLPNVRLANGQTLRETRRRLMLTFNTPFFPEVLIASSVMAEGVDLHLNCRHVIHHDLDWNPSVLEQRTGRVDRLGSLSERSAQPVVVFEPFLEATQDEKQFRVVKDRERWFNVVMGEPLRLDEWTTDRIAKRVPLPSAAAASLTLDLSVR